VGDVRVAHGHRKLASRERCPPAARDRRHGAGQPVQRPAERELRRIDASIGVRSVVLQDGQHRGIERGGIVLVLKARQVIEPATGDGLDQHAGGVAVEGEELILEDLPVSRDDVESHPERARIADSVEQATKHATLRPLVG
jgi:hypothetical protein